MYLWKPIWKLTSVESCWMLLAILSVVDLSDWPVVNLCGGRQPAVAATAIMCMICFYMLIQCELIQAADLLIIRALSKQTHWGLVSTLPFIELGKSFRSLITIHMDGHAIPSFYNSNSVGKKAIVTIITNPFKRLVIKTIFLLEIGLNTVYHKDGNVWNWITCVMGG